MSEERPPRDEAAGEPDRGPAWKVDKEESLARLRKADDPPGGRLVYVDEHGGRRRLPADMSRLTPEERRAAMTALSGALGAPDPDYARLAAVERLTEIRAAGRISEEDFIRERRRLMDYG
ncbi:MAG: hypothetical protein M3459_00370 [Actinomycetota bacterium]|nr:hypothetical protein [Actinomycetota bacterium]